MKETAFIYALCRPDNGEVRYVGKTHSPKDRLRDHLKEAGNTPKTAWIKSLRKIGLRPSIEIIDEFPHEHESEWQRAERFWISYFRFLGFRLTNSEDGGMGGKRLSEETRRKLRAVNIGKVTPEYIRAKQSAAMIGRKKSAETRARMSAAQRKIEKSPKQLERLRAMTRSITKETREKIAATKRGVKQPPEVIAKRVAKMIGVKQDPERVRKRAEILRGKKRTPEQIDRLKEAGREVWRRRNSGELPPRKERRDSIRKRLALSVSALNGPQMAGMNTASGGDFFLK